MKNFRCCIGNIHLDIFPEILVKLLLIDISGFFWFYKLEGVIALVVCFVCIFEDIIFFYLQFADDEAMRCWGNEMLSTIISNTTCKTSNAIVTGILFDLFSYFDVPVPSQKYKWLVFKRIENSTDIVVEALEYRKIISHKLASWSVHVDDADMFRVRNEFAFGGNFRNRKALVSFPIFLNFRTYTVLEFWRCFFDVVCTLFGVG